MNNILLALMWFAIFGAGFGLLLAIASKAFYVKVDQRIPEICDALPGANCGGCGYTGCTALAEAIVKGEAKINACVVADSEAIEKIAEIMGCKAEAAVRMRAQVMCSGSSGRAKKKYIYKGANDCIAATKLGGGDKLCPNGCIGLGTCTEVCTFGALKIVDGVAKVDDSLCIGCGQCTSACPKHIIKLVPFDAPYRVACMSVDKGPVTKSYCEVGCISCRICEKNCPAGAITVNDFVASIDYEKCTGCGVCAEKCPRKIIHCDKSVTVDAG